MRLDNPRALIGPFSHSCVLIGGARSRCDVQLLRISHTSLDQSLVTVSVRLASGQGEETVIIGYSALSSDVLLEII